MFCLVLIDVRTSRLAFATANLTLQLLDAELGTKILGAGTERVGQVLGVDSKAMGGVTDTVAKVADIESLRDPVLRDAAEDGRKAVHVLGGSATVGVDVASKAHTVLWVSDKEDALNGIECGASQHRQRVRSGGRTLRVALEDEALVRASGEGALDFAYDVVSTESRDLAEVGGVDGVVHLASRDLALDVGVHRTESRGGTLQFSGSTSINDCVRRTGARAGKNSALNS